MYDDLLVSLIKRGKKDEDFVTEVFAWIIRNNESLARLIIKKILGKTVQITTEIECNTQVSRARIRPDMVIEFDDTTIISEHKIKASVYEKQIKNYRNYAEKNYRNFKIVLITAKPRQYTSKESDVNLCWSDIYEIIEEWLAKNKKIENRVVATSFLTLLEYLEIGPPSPVNYSPEQPYDTNTAKQLSKELRDFLNYLEGRFKEEYEEKLKSIGKGQNFKKSFFSPRWCRFRYGFYLFKRWNPGLFIGFLLDERDHKVEPLTGVKSPTFALMVDFDQKHHKKYPKNKSYIQFKKGLNEIIKERKTSYEWELYDIAEQGGGQNKWNPLHIWVPMSKLFPGVETIKEQADRFFEYAENIIPPVLELDSLKEMRDKEFK